jgi:GntR family transcriptional regulator/MocR family aminotransferase
VARVLSSRGIDSGPEDILVTSGSQEAILLCALLALRRGGPVLVESPTYAVAMGLFRALGLEVVGVPVDGGGIRIDALERAIGERRPSLIYSMPNFQNPTGASLEAGRRSALVALAERHALPILEDDYVGDLRLEGRDLPALASIAAPGAVLYTGTFSKMLAPGFRVGYLMARGPVRALLLDLKYRVSLASPNVEQRALRSVVSVGGYENHIRRSRRRYRERRDALMLAVAESLPGFRADRPAGGLFAWLRLPEGLGSRRLAEACRARGVLVYPGWPCFPDPADPEADCYLRLNFAAEREERIEEGVRRIAAAAAGIASPGLPAGSS